ncbi:MAG: hypothetical protein MZV63_29185 [Marinilabiliales bacterium]|nr:hypothetical protein [Marinilabiliales bacterium]
MYIYMSQFLVLCRDISLKHKIALGLIPRIGDINARKLVSHFGSVEAVFHEPYRNLIKIPGIGSGLAKYISDRSYLEAAEKEAEYVTKNNIKTYFYLDSDYPFQAADSATIRPLYSSSRENAT